MTENKRPYDRLLQSIAILRRPFYAYETRPPFHAANVDAWLSVGTHSDIAIQGCDFDLHCAKV